jgi:hypothetical protein
MTFDLKDIRAALIQAAESLWARKIKDVADGEVNPAITSIFDETGWGDWLRGPGGCPEGYTRPPDPDYCGLTYAWASLHVGRWIVPWDTYPDFGVDQALCDHIFSSTARLAMPRRWAKTPHEQPTPQEAGQMRPGDIVVLGHDKWCGDHIVMPLGPPSHKGTFSTIEGNASGRLPGGERGKGIVKCEHDVSEVFRVYPLQRAWYPVVQDGTE